MRKIFVGDVGTVILLDCGVDISTATLVKVLVKPPSGAPREWTGIVVGTRMIEYVIQTGDLNLAGEWRLQAYVEMPGWSGRGQPVVVTVAA